jgi:hypothetical protein
MMFTASGGTKAVVAVSAAAVIISGMYLNHPWAGSLGGVFIALVGSTEYGSEISDFLEEGYRNYLPPVQPKYWLNP